MTVKRICIAGLVAYNILRRHTIFFKYYKTYTCNLIARKTITRVDDGFVITMETVTKIVTRVDNGFLIVTKTVTGVFVAFMTGIHRDYDASINASSHHYRKAQRAQLRGSEPQRSDTSGSVGQRHISAFATSLGAEFTIDD